MSAGTAAISAIDLTEPVHGVGVQLGGRLGGLITGLSLTQNEVARRMELNPSIINLWTAGKRPVPANRLPRLAAALGVTVEELLDGRAVESTASPVRSTPRSIDHLPDAPRPLVERHFPVSWELEWKCLLCGHATPAPHDPRRCASCGARSMVRDEA